jgi:hypothetical protein
VTSESQAVDGAEGAAEAEVVKEVEAAVRL